LAGFPPNNTFSGIGPGSSLDPDVTFNPNRPNGTYSDAIFLSPTSKNSSSTSNLSLIELDLVARVAPVPEPSSTLLAMVGGFGLLALLRGRRHN
jgi:hypothetical protein